MSDTSARLLHLLSLLQTPREWPGSELAERMGVSPRTIRRDVDRLRALGYPVEATMGSVGGYRLVAGQAMPPLLLDDEEAVAIAVGLRAAAGHAVEGIEEASLRALTKLERVLPSRLRHRVGALNAATVRLMSWSGPTVDPELLTVLATAITGRERLRFAYHPAWRNDGSPGREVGPGKPPAGPVGDVPLTRRLVEPHRLVSAGRRWYLVGFDNDREDWRLFRVDRISEARRTGVRVAPRVLPDPDAGAYVERKLSQLGGRTHRAVATLHAPAAEVAPRLAGAGDLEPVDERTCRLHSRADSLEWLAVRLSLLGCEFEVHEPAELVDFLREMGARVTRATGG